MTIFEREEGGLSLLMADRGIKPEANI